MLRIDERFPRRRRKGTRGMEYFVAPKKAWFVIDEMVDFKSVDLSQDAMRGRLNKKDSPYFNVWDAIHGMKTGNNSGEKLPVDMWFIDFMKLMPVGSLANKYRILGSK